MWKLIKQLVQCGHTWHNWCYVPSIYCSCRQYFRRTRYNIHIQHRAEATRCVSIHQSELFVLHRLKACASYRIHMASIFGNLALCRAAQPRLRVLATALSSLSRATNDRNVPHTLTDTMMIV